jgi:GxxExxY protein
MSFYELKNAGLRVIKEVPLPLVYEDVHLDCGYRLDLFIEDQLVIEVKSVDALNDIHMAQVLTYLKLTNCKYGLLINFNVLKLVSGIRRLVNKYKE